MECQATTGPVAAFIGGEIAVATLAGQFWAILGISRGHNEVFTGTQMKARPEFVVLLAAMLAGCSWYRPEPLPVRPDLQTSLPAPQHALSMVEVASIAVRENPDLIAARKKLNVAKAQAFVAGLLPSPQFSGEIDYPTQIGFVNGYSYGLAEDIQALLLTPSRRNAAKATEDQAKLEALWQEWQTVEKACSLFTQKFYGEQKVALLAEQEKILSEQADHSTSALAKGDTTIDQAGPDLATALDTASQLNTARRDSLGADTDLKELLALSPAASISLVPLPDPPSFAKSEIEKALSNIAKLRPDLLALQAGYKAQEEAVFQSVLSQFPAITLGGNRAADTTDVHTSGLTASVNLPIFDFGQGAISVQRATRAQLKAEYTARLDQTTADVWRTWEQCELLREEIGELEKRMPAFRKMADEAATAYRAGNLAAATYVLMQSSRIARESELIDLRSALWTNTLALRTLLGMSYAPSAAEKPA